MATNTVVTNNTGGYTANTAADVYTESRWLSAMIARSADELRSYVDSRTDPVLLEFLQHLIRDHPMFKAEFAAFMARKKMGIDSV